MHFAEAECDAQKVQEVIHNGHVTTIYVPKGDCTAKSICLYAHDGSFKLDNPTVVPLSCSSNDKHPCNMCKFELTVRTLCLLLDKSLDINFLSSV